MKELIMVIIFWLIVIGISYLNNIEKNRIQFKKLVDERLKVQANELKLKQKKLDVKIKEDEKRRLNQEKKVETLIKENEVKNSQSDLTKNNESVTIVRTLRERRNYRKIIKNNNILNESTLNHKLKENWEGFQDILSINGITKFYHFTDSENLNSIRKYGGLYSWWKADQLGIEIPKAGGIGFGRGLDLHYGLENYVRLSFTKNHPMLYIAKRENKILNPVILEIDISVAYLEDTRFSNMNATKTGHKQGKNLEDLSRIKFELVNKASHFDISENEKHYYQAEILVLEKIPIEYITNLNN